MPKSKLKNFNSLEQGKGFSWHLYQESVKFKPLLTFSVYANPSSSCSDAP